MSKINSDSLNSVAGNDHIENNDSFIRKATPAERAAFFMDPRNKIDNICCANSMKDRRISSKDFLTRGITNLNAHFYKSQTNRLHHHTNSICADCCDNNDSFCQNCHNNTDSQAQEENNIQKN